MTDPSGMMSGQGMMGGQGAQPAAPIGSLDAAKQSFQGYLDRIGNQDLMLDEVMQFQSLLPVTRRFAIQQNHDPRHHDPADLSTGRRLLTDDGNSLKIGTLHLHRGRRRDPSLTGSR